MLNEKELPAHLKSLLLPAITVSTVLSIRNETAIKIPSESNIQF